MSEGGKPLPGGELRARLAAQGFHPSRRLGQNFLQDANMARAIARDARVGPGDVVVEIGPGAGSLTVHLVELGVELIAIEIDPRLLEIAKSLLEHAPSVRWIQGDALASKRAWNVELQAALPAREPWHLVSNLPYSAASPILALAARLDNPPRSVTVLVQTEVAERIAAEPGGREWGPLSVRIQLVYAPAIVRKVPAQLFWPRPQVDSSVLRLDLRDERPSAADLEELDLLVDQLFQHRRQTLGGLLARRGGSRARAAALRARQPVDPGRRPETRSAEQLLALSRDPAWRSRPAKS
jgi:16S rRNA (adenine1518-N6/adenine1519-N6)-dimethyltransferase